MSTRMIWEWLGSPEYPGVIKRGQHPPEHALCWLCGEPVGPGPWGRDAWLTPTFTNHTLAACPASDAICQPCAYLGSGDSWRAYCAAHPEMGLKSVHPLSWRTYSHVFAEGIHACPGRTAWKRWLLDPPEPPFSIILARKPNHVCDAVITEADHLRFRLPSFQRKLQRALDVIDRALSQSSCPYVAFSGGKDSLVVLGLASLVRPGVEAIWCDHELETPESVAYITSITEHLPVRLTVARCHSPHAEWFRPWADSPYWRDPIPDTVDMGDSPRLASRAHGYDLSLLGLRAQEAIYRRYNAARGRLYQVASTQWHCQPIVGWSVDEVWAAIAGMGLMYNPVYDRLAEVGVERETQRVGPLPLSPGWILQRGWPEMYRRLVGRYGQRW